MHIARLHQCLSCNKLVPIIQTKCDCGAPFSGSELIYKVCPSCGSVIRGARLRCDCGFLFIFRRFLDKQSVQLITQADLDAARKKGEDDGKLLEVMRSEKELSKLQQEKDAAFERGTMLERRKNDAEWKHFFDAAKLKNTITGEPICSREEFYKWHKQYSEAKAERERQTKSEAAKPTVEKPVANGPHSPNVHINYKWKGDIAFEVILEYAFKIDDLVSPCVPEKNADFSPYICIAALCAWSEVVLGAERKFVQYVVREVSSSYDLSAAENSAALERLMYASADTVGFALEGKEQGQLFEYASDAIMRLLKLDPDVDVMVKIAFLLRDFTLEYAERRKGGI